MALQPRSLEQGRDQDSPALASLLHHAAAAQRSQTRREAVLTTSLVLFWGWDPGLLLRHLHGLLLGVVALLLLVLRVRLGSLVNGIAIKVPDW